MPGSSHTPHSSIRQSLLSCPPQTSLRLNRRLAHFPFAPAILPNASAVFVAACSSDPHSCLSCGVFGQRERSCPQHPLLQLSVSSVHISSSVTIDCAFCGAAQSAGLAPHCGCRLFLLVPTAVQTVQYRPPCLHPTCIPDWRVAWLSSWGSRLLFVAGDIVTATALYRARSVTL